VNSDAGSEPEPGAPPVEASVADPDLLAALLEVHRHLDLSDQIQVIVERTAAWTAAEACFGLAPDDDRQVLVPVASRCSQGTWDLTGTRLPLAAVRAWVEEGEPAGCAATMLASSVPASSVMLPLRGEGKDAEGVVVLVGVKRAGADLDRARRFVGLARKAIENAIQVRAVRELVIKDDTTECFNRRYFEEFLAEELSRASRFHAPLSLIFFDMDGLKQVNSLLGHAMGSRVLNEVSVRVRGKVRKFDKLFRFGGDEFCIVLPETEWHGALEVAERVRTAIAGKLFLGEQLGDRGGVKMTASFGLASFPLHARTKGELLERADWAMQRIKAGMKNAIAVAEIAEEGHGA
jgi:diguanylate cyclase (GGDEF)-like protein